MLLFVALFHFKVGFKGFIKGWLSIISFGLKWTNFSKWILSSAFNYVSYGKWGDAYY